MLGRANIPGAFLAVMAAAVLLEAGGPAPHWAFQPVQSPALPGVRDTGWCRTSVDRFVLARLESAGRMPSAEAGRRAWLRRVTLDLTGLPPTAAETDAFEADPGGDAHERVVERLLGSPAYGERWGRHWLDVARYADTAGETADYPVPVAWRYRDYVIRAFNADKPYDVFVQEQLAGDILAAQGDPALHGERVTATGFLAVSRRFGFDSENYHHLTLQDAIDTVGQGVLGLTLGCARCHAHKYDPVPITDYYALYGILDGTRFAFPGSEQKQRVRSMASVASPAEALPRWREHEWRVSELSRRLEALGKPGPSAVLRPVEGMDGDLELQAPAAGGSKGVLVPPWVYEGTIAVTTDAQSPFRNVHPQGRVGAAVASGTNSWWMEQAVPPALRALLGRSPTWHAQIDFKAGLEPGDATGRHRFWLGPRREAPWLQVRFDGRRAWLVGAGGEEVGADLPAPGEWHNLRIEVDVDSGTARAWVGVPGNVREMGRVRAPGGRQLLAGLRLGVGSDPSDRAGAVRGALWLDHVELREERLGPVTRDLPALAWEGGSPSDVRRELEALAGMDGDLELQRDGAAPSAPWHPGPNSVVKASVESQSPWRNLHPPGRLGLRMPAGEAYNGFGQTLAPAWAATRTERLHVGFDFRCGGQEPGTWRHYVGHGAGSSAATEVHFHGSALFVRDGAEMRRVAAVKAGRWHQVRMVLDLRARRFSGVLDDGESATSFEGALAKGWDGQVDYTFIDSHGHVGGAKPVLDADNLVVREAPLPGRDSVASAAGGAGRLERMEALRGRMAAMEAQAAPLRRELERLLVDGPVELAYAVSEGTPRDARVQLRGDPDQLGEVVPRGLLGALGGGRLAAGTAGSGRLELARWLTDARNPLTARVMVNRIWAHHFGAGLVTTPNDFGLRGARPSDPALLDHLATEFVRSGWSVKAMHRRLVLSATYRQSSHGLERAVAPGKPADAECPVPGVAGAGAGATPDGAGWAPFARRRLSAEELRDALLAASGGLDREHGGGHPFPLPTTWGYTQHGPFTAVYGHERRGVYLMSQRLQRHPFLALFDGADPNGSTAGRRTTTVPTQALYFMNDPFVHAAAERVAARAARESGDAAGRVEAAYRMVLGRSPTPEEREDAVGLVQDPRVAGTGALASLARVLMSSNEFLTVD